jgi:CBS domain-containing protein
MNPEIVYLREGSRAGIALRPILDFGITAVPILDEEDRPVGVVSLRDLVDSKRPTVEPSRPPICVGVDAGVEDAARILTKAGVHHLIVIDDGGRAVGVLSSLDVLRGLLGEESKHPGKISSFRDATSDSHRAH